ncbi:MAG: MFS transporter [Ktedonobacteraceae bacterium]|nr:MFS transporter [Ktedonobacteraceae bacterium]
MTLSKKETTSVPAHTKGIWSSPYWSLTIGLMLFTLGPAFEELAVPIVLPNTVAQLGGLAWYGWTFSMFMLTSLVGIVIGGDQADRHGLAVAYGTGMLLFDLGLLVAGVAPSMAMLLLGRAIQGFGAGTLASLGNTAIGRLYPDTCKPQMLALLSTTFVIPGLIGPSFAGMIVALIGWRWVFLGLLPLGPLAMLFVVSSMKLGSPFPQRIQEQRNANGQRIVTTGQLVLGATLALLGLAIHSIPLLLLFVVGGLTMGGMALRRLLPSGTLTARAGLPAAIATLGLLGLTYFGERAFLPLALTSMQAQSSLVAGMAVTAATLTWTVGAWIQTRVVSRYGRRPLVLTGLALLIVGTVGTTSLLFPSVPVVVVVVAWAIAGTGMGIAFATANLVVLETAPTDQEGYAVASMQLSTTLGFALGTGLEGAIIGISTEAWKSLTGGTIMITIIFLASACLAVLAAFRLPGKTHEPISSLAPNVLERGDSPA